MTPIRVVLLLVVTALVSLDDVLCDAERGRALGGVEGCDAPTRARPEVVEPAAACNALRDQVDGARDLAELGPDGIERSCKFPLST